MYQKTVFWREKDLMPLHYTDKSSTIVEKIVKIGKNRKKSEFELENQ